MKSRTGRMESLEGIHPDYLEIHPVDAHKYGLPDGEPGFGS
jgi:hypothetical protein